MKNEGEYGFLEFGQIFPPLVPRLGEKILMQYDVNVDIRPFVRELLKYIYEGEGYPLIIANFDTSIKDILNDYPFLKEWENVVFVDFFTKMYGKITDTVGEGRIHPELDVEKEWIQNLNKIIYPPMKTGSMDLGSVHDVCCNLGIKHFREYGNSVIILYNFNSPFFRDFWSAFHFSTHFGFSFSRFNGFSFWITIKGLPNENLIRSTFPTVFELRRYSSDIGGGGVIEVVKSKLPTKIKTLKYLEKEENILLIQGAED
jgi:hypothetical protein